MLCSDCKKNNAVVFVNQKDNNGKNTLEGYCYECAKKRGINPIDNLMKQANLSENDLNNMTEQFEAMFNDMSENLNFSDTNDDNETYSSDEAKKGMQFGAIPLGSIFSNMFNPVENENNQDSGSGNKKKVKVDKKNNKRKKALDTYGTNLTQKAKNDELDAVIGRDKEIQRIIQILNRRSKNNPCLIGEPGVGKTAIAQGLAIKISQGKVPAKLLNKEVYLLDMTAVIAGTQFRGQFEARMKSIIDECKSLKNIILVIDEIHNIIGAGDAEHAMNAANILKPSLANGELQLVGTTTLKEYRKYIEKDTALERRFQPVIVAEPSIDDTIGILDGIKKYYEDYHKVRISTDVIKQTVLMSEKYIHDRFLPDKAIDILDEACSRINLDNKELYDLEVLKNELAKIQEEKEEAAQADSTEDYQKAAELKTKECALTEKIDDISNKLQLKNLTIQDIAEVIESWTKIPVKKITEAETQKLLNLENNLHKRIIGQNEAVEAVSRAIRRNRAGLKSTKRPPSFIFVGPTGVGKTELAKSLAYEMFGSEDSIIRIDMSEYMEKHSVSRLIGPPPGYIGYEEGGQLTEAVRRKPYSVVLLDEIEKAHEDVFNILLQIMDDGRLTDSKGKIVNFKNTIIIMTSNEGAQKLKKQNTMGFFSDVNNNAVQYEKMKEFIMGELKNKFRPEFLNRLDEIIVFNQLNEENIKNIVDIMLSDTINRLKEKEIFLDYDKELNKFIADKNENLSFGARPIRRIITREIEDKLSDEMLKGEIKRGDRLSVCFKDDELIFAHK